MYVMNALGKSITRKLGYSFGANIVSLLVSVFSISFVPKYMAVEEYGLYQLFLFYFGYVGFLHFGVLGGAIIRFAGRRYDELDYPMLKTQCAILFAILCVLSTGLFLLNIEARVFESPISYFFLISMVAQHVIWYSISMLQMSNRIEESAKLLFVDRMSWGIFGVGAVLAGYVAAIHVILAYTITRVVAMLYSLSFVPEIVWAPVRLTKDAWREFQINFVLGFPMTLSDVCSILVMGIIRFGISDVWDISVFAKTSLALGFTFFFMSFISSASVVLLPALRQLSAETADDLYIPLNRLLSLFFLVVLLGYFPLKEIIALWLPNYVDGLAFMGILFPALFFESKFSLLVATYLKKMLKTRVILLVNLFAAMCSAAGCLLFCYYLKNVTLAIFLITLVLGVRCTLAEFILGRFLHLGKPLVAEWIRALCVIALFECIAMQVEALWAGLVYGLVLVIYALLSRKRVGQAWQQVKQVVTA